MAKKLENIRENAIIETRKVLEEQGYEMLTMRDIAKKCDIAVGTMYNHFPSKEYLTGCVVLEDWTAVYECMTGAASNADSIGRGIYDIYDMMCKFAAQHRYLTSFNSREAKTPCDFHERHTVLLKQIKALLEMLQKRFGCSVEDSITVFIAESILSFSVKKYSYSQIAPAIMKLLN